MQTLGQAVGDSIAAGMRPQGAYAYDYRNGSDIDSDNYNPVANYDYRNGSDVESDNANRQRYRAAIDTGLGFSDSANDSQLMAYLMRQAGYGDGMTPTAGVPTAIGNLIGESIDGVEDLSMPSQGKPDVGVDVLAPSAKATRSQRYFEGNRYLQFNDLPTGETTWEDIQGNCMSDPCPVIEARPRSEMPAPRDCIQRAEPRIV